MHTYRRGNQTGRIIHLLNSYMKYLIFCTQRRTYFADKSKFDSLDQVRDQIISYHSIDMDGEDLQKIKKMNLAELESFFEWRVCDEQENRVDKSLLEKITAKKK